MPYETPEQAYAVARSLGCEGVHTRDGVYYPCKTEEEYQSLKKTSSRSIKVPAPDGYHWMVFDEEGIKLMPNGPTGLVPHKNATRVLEVQIIDEPTEKAEGSKRGGPQIRLYDINRAVVSKLKDHDLRMMWKRLKQWYAMGNTKGDKRMGMLQAARLLYKEMKRRGMKVSEGDQMARLVGKADILFVVAEPTPLEKARKQYLVGPDGETFKYSYLEPMGLDKDDIQIMDIQEYAKAYGKPGSTHTLTVALGRVAKEFLADRATHTLPHPAALRRHGDSGEVGRKIKSMFRYITEIENERVNVSISKSDDLKKIVYSAVLSPDSEDAHGDMIPVNEIEETAHKYLDKSRTIGRQHSELANAKVVESYVVHYPSDEDYRKALSGEDHKSYRIPFGNDYITSGTWVMGVKLGEDEYQAVRRGDITGFSIGGYGRRIKREKNDLPEITYLTLQSEPLTDNPLVEGVDSPLNQPLD